MKKASIAQQQISIHEITTQLENKEYEIQKKKRTRREISYVSVF